MLVQVLDSSTTKYQGDSQEIKNDCMGKNAELIDPYDLHVPED